MAQTIIKGNDLMLFDAQGKSIAYATSHTLSISGETTDVTSKDHGIYGGNEVNKINWEITSENLYTTTEFDNLFTQMIARTAIDVYWGVKTENDPTKSVVDGDYDNWSISTISGGGAYKGKAFITSLTANANNGENATFNVTLTGTGKIAKQ